MILSQWSTVFGQWVSDSVWHEFAGHWRPLPVILTNYGHVFDKIIPYRHWLWPVDIYRLQDLQCWPVSCVPSIVYVHASDQASWRLSTIIVYIWYSSHEGPTSELVQVHRSMVCILRAKPVTPVHDQDLWNRDCWKQLAQSQVKQNYCFCLWWRHFCCCLYFSVCTVDTRYWFSTTKQKSKPKFSKLKVCFEGIAGYGMAVSYFHCLATPLFLYGIIYVTWCISDLPEPTMFTYQKPTSHTHRLYPFCQTCSYLCDRVNNITVMEAYKCNVQVKVVSSESRNFFCFLSSF